MGVRRMPEAGPGSAQTVRVLTRRATRRETYRVGSRAGISRRVPEVPGDCGKHRVAGEVRRFQELGMERSNGTRSRSVSDSGTRAAVGGDEWQVIREHRA